METFEITILGCGAALPTPRHMGSAQIVDIRGKLFLLDCAEGTQTALRRAHAHLPRLRAVFLSHLHGDHVFGLPGLLSTLGLLGRRQELHVYGPKPLRAVYQPHIDHFCAEKNYPIILHEIEPLAPTTIYEDRSLTVRAFPLRHRIPCCGYVICEKLEPRHIIREAIERYQIPTAQINNIKAGGDWVTPHGDRIPNQLLTTPPNSPRSYAYCTDTAPSTAVTSAARGVTCLYHEATFTEEHAALARKTFHSTAADAARTALLTEAGRLVIGHFSPRYNSEETLLREATAIFPHTTLAADGMTLQL